MLSSDQHSAATAKTKSLSKAGAIWLGSDPVMKNLYSNYPPTGDGGEEAVKDFVIRPSETDAAHISKHSITCTAPSRRTEKREYHLLFLIARKGERRSSIAPVYLRALLLFALISRSLITHIHAKHIRERLRLKPEIVIVHIAPGRKCILGFGPCPSAVESVQQMGARQTKPSRSRSYQSEFFFFN